MNADLHLAQVPARTVQVMDLDQYYRPLRNMDGRFWQDRNAMKAGNFTGITGFPNQDVAMWISMGVIADRTHDRLGASDMAIVEFRKQMLEAVKQFMADGTAIEVGERAIPGSLLVPGHRAQGNRLARLFRHCVWLDKIENPENDKNYQVQ